MKNEKKELFITEISLEDFKKLNLIGYQHTKHYYKINRDGDHMLPETEVDYEQTGEIVEDSEGTPHWVSHKGFFTRLEWDKVELNQLVDELIEKCKEIGSTNPICVAIHEEVEDENASGDMSINMFQSSYLDKWLTPMGMQTFITGIDVKHLYSKRNYFYDTGDYFEIDKRETKAIYLIHWN